MRFAKKIDATRLQSGRITLFVVGLVIGLIATACSTGTAQPTPLPSVPAASQDSPTSQAALQGTEEFGLTQEELVTNVDAVEALIASCMNEAGFEYIAADFETVRAGMLAVKSFPELSEDEYIALYGYGISTLYTGLDPQLADADTPAKIGLGEQNVQIYNSLSPTDRVAYGRTLLGENTDATFAVTLEAEDFSRTGGCTRAAVEQIFTPEQLVVNYVNPLERRIEQDPRMITALAEFADCIRAEGFDYSHPVEAEEDIRLRLAAITNGDPLEALSAEAQAALTELQGEERAIAAVTFACEEDIIDPVEDQIERELFARQDE